MQYYICTDGQQTSSTEYTGCSCAGLQVTGTQVQNSTQYDPQDINITIQRQSLHLSHTEGNVKLLSSIF